MHRVIIAVTAAAFSAALSTSFAGAQIRIDWVTVGNPGNAPDPATGRGSVGYEFRIGATEVTNAQYAAFLNAVAATDPNRLYSESMGSSFRGGIVRSGVDGAFTYAVRANMGDKPANFMSWYDAARMANWMTNGQGLGGGSGDTESGVYAFTGLVSISAITRDLSNPNQVFIPTEDEWYKAAYHHPAAQGGDADNYWLYATRSNSTPAIATATTTGDVANPGQNIVNYNLGADWNGQTGNVTTVGSAGSQTFYGAFDMNGNVFEWNETLFSASRGVRGGSFATVRGTLRSFARDDDIASVGNGGRGFRLASPVPAPVGCNPADLAEPFNQLDIADVVQYLQLFGAADPAADLAIPTGTFDIADVVAFLQIFGAGCP